MSVIQVLSATTHKLRIVVDANATTNESRCTVNYSKQTATVAHTGLTAVLSATTGTTAVDLIGPPGASEEWSIVNIVIWNRDTVDHTYTIYLDVSGTQYNLYTAQRVLAGKSTILAVGGSGGSSSGGSVSGPATSTNRAVATWNGTAGDTLRDNSLNTIDASGIATDVSQLLTGASGADSAYTEYLFQTSTPAAPAATGFRILPTSAGVLAFRIKNGTDTYTRSFPGTLTADRAYTLQDKAGTLAFTSDFSFAQGRLCGSATDPIADSSAVTTLYYTPFTGKFITVISSSVAKTMSFAATSLSLSGYTANKAYDIWGYDNSGTFALDSTVWTNDSTRATALSWDSTLGDYVKNGDSTRRYLGTIYIDNAGGAVTCTSSVRNIWNRHNQIPMLIDCFIGTRNTTEYTTSSTSFTNVNGNSTLGQGKFGWVVGLAVKTVDLTWALTMLGADTTGVFATAAILLAGTGSGTVSQGVNTANASAGVPSSITIPMFYTPAVGYWTAQKQFKTFSNNARLQENGFIGTFWG